MASRDDGDAVTDLLADVLDALTGKTDHLYCGSCPDGYGPSAHDARDPDCPVCELIGRVEAASAPELAAENERLRGLLQPMFDALEKDMAGMCDCDYADGTTCDWCLLLPKLAAALKETP